VRALVRLPFVLALVALGAIAIPVRAVAQVPDAIGYKGPTGRLEAQSGGVWKTALVLSNRRAGPMRLTPRVQLPRDWRPLMAPEPFEVPPGTTNLFVLNAVVPRTAAAGTYRVVVEFESHRGESVRDTLSVAVMPRQALRVSGEAGPRYARIDTTVTVDFVVRNEGNVRMAVDLSARAVEASATIRDSSRLALRPGDVRYVAVLVGPTRTGRVQLVELHARAVGGGEYSDAFELLRVAEAPPTRVVLPLNVRMRAYESAVTPSEITGGIVGRRDTFDLLVRRPGELGSLFGERDEYRLRWSGARGRFVAGDMVANESPIRDSYEMLTGIDAALRVGPVTASGYAGRDRLLGTDASEEGASLSMRPFGSLTLGGGALQRSGVDSGDGRAWRAFASLGENGLGLPSLRAEISQGQGGSSAYGVRAHSRFSRAWVDVSAGEIGGNYPARERGSSRSSVGLGARVTRHVSLRAWGGRYEMDTLPTRPFAFTSNSYSAGLVVGPLTAEYRHEEREAVIDGFRYSNWDEGARATIGGAFGPATFTAGAELGSSFDARSANAQRAPFQRFSGSAYFSRSRRWSGGISLEHYSREGLARNQQLSGTITTSARLFPGTRLELTGSLFHVVFPTVQSYSNVNARIEQSLGHGHSVSLRTRTFAMSASSTLPLRQQTTFFLEYGLPFQVPLPWVGARQVRARVVEAGSGNAIPGALVRMGEYTAITNREGRVTFAPTAAMYALLVERADASVPLVVDAPDLAAARRGARREVTISVGEGARIIGRVTRYDRVRRDSVAPAGGIANVIVTMTRGADTLNVVTREDGNFEFRQLPPGSWRVTVSGGRIPAAYGFERYTATVVAEAGRASSLEFRVVSRAEEAALQDGGSLSLPKPEGKRDPKQQSRPPR
jgi:hypothetical protein